MYYFIIQTTLIIECQQSTYFIIAEKYVHLVKNILQVIFCLQKNLI